MKTDSNPEAEDKRVQPDTPGTGTDATEDKQQPCVAPSVKPGFLTRAWQACCAPFANIKLPTWNLRLFAWLLGVLIVAVFLLSNWVPMRFYLFGCWIEAPRALSIVVLLAIGFLAGWLSRSPHREQESESEE